MDIGNGLPTTLSLDGPLLVEWARRAEQRGFAIEYGAGWTAGGGGPAMAGPMVEKVRRGWHEAGRPGEPRIAGLAYYGLGDEAASRAALRAYHGFLPDNVDLIVESAVRTPAAVRQVVGKYADAGMTDLVLFPTVADLAEVDRLADVVL